MSEEKKEVAFVTVQNLKIPRRIFEGWVGKEITGRALSLVDEIEDYPNLAPPPGSVGALDRSHRKLLHMADRARETAALLVQLADLCSQLVVAEAEIDSE